jgi:hypothetical protein
MTERLLQYIWQFQYFNKNDLVTAGGEELIIIQPGTYNTHQGPDFMGGRIRLGSNTWIGNIELHVNASDWQRHQHSSDKNYHNVILHVVWNNDRECVVGNIPTLSLCDRVPKVLLQQYYSWMKADCFIPCASSAANADDLVWTSWKQRLMYERLERKSGFVFSLLSGNRFHWEETMWWMLARNFGLSVNADAFGEVAASIPYNVVSKHRAQIHQLEALMFGQAGLLESDVEDKYALMLKKEYSFLQKKYGLCKINMPVHFLRMRPACFPTVRLAQLAMLMHVTTSLFSTVLNESSVQEIKRLLAVTANDYWHYHFRFGEATVYQPKTVGGEMINSIIMNTVVPIIFAYGKYHHESCFQHKAVEWIEKLPAESNATVSKFRGIGVLAKNASDTQSLIELKTQYCDEKRCLDCAIANALLKKDIKVL